MLTLGIESSCDETAVSIVRDGKEILCNLIATQTDLQAQYGGVYPEVAARRHIEVILPLVKEALLTAKVSKNDLDLIAVANEPGLAGPLLIGINFAKGLSAGWNLPLVFVNHVEAHVYAAMMSQDTPPIFPALGVVISGGHTLLLKMESPLKYEVIGSTIDDAIGEAFDKVARMLDLPYPGGPEIEKLAKLGDPTKYNLKPGRVKNRPFHFSFSGLKTKVLYTVKGQGANRHSPTIIEEGDKKHIAASFQNGAFSHLIDKTVLAAKEHDCKAIYIGGGVSNSKTLREMFQKRNTKIPLYWPSFDLSLDNAAMIAGLGTLLFRATIVK